MAQQKPKPVESEWEEIDNPDEWEEIPDPALTQEVGPPISAAPPEQPPPYTGPTDWLSGFTKSVLGGEAMHASDESARGWLQGSIGDLPHGLYEGAKMLATSNPIGYAAYHAMGHDMPAEEAGKNLIPSLKNVWDLGVKSGGQPYEFGRALGQLTGQPAMTEGLFGNVPGLPSGVDIVKGAGRGVETAGRIMKDYSPVTDVGTRTLAGAAGYKYGGFPAAVLGAKYGGAPKILKGLESAFGGKLERGGQWMRNIDGSIDAAALEDFYGKNSPDAQSPITRISSTRVGGARDPILESPFHPSDAEALKDYRNWTSGPEHTPPPVTINESPLGPFDRAPLSEAPTTPEVAPSTAVDPGRPLTAFEKYMRNKKSTTGGEAPMVDVEGNELAFNQQEVPEIAKEAGASLNPDMEIKWPQAPTPEELSKMTAGGFQFDSATNIFRKLKKAVTSAAERFGAEETGTFDPVTMWKNIKEYFGESPSRNVDDWRQALVRAGAAGDEEAIRIISAHVRELEAQQPPIDAVDVVHDPTPPIMREALGDDWIPEFESPAPQRDFDSLSSAEQDAIVRQHHEVETARLNEPDTEFEPDPTHPANRSPQQDLEATTNAIANERPPTMVVNHAWQLWDLMDRWSNLQESARAAGDYALAHEIRGHIVDLDQQMISMRNQPFGTGNVETLDPTPLEQANAHLPTPANPHTYGASFPESVRNYVSPTPREPSPLVPYTPGVRTPFTPPISSTSYIPPPRIGQSHRPYVSGDRIRQQMNDLGIQPDQEQWYRALNSESVEFPEEGTQPTQDILGLREMNSLGEIENARFTDPDFGWTEPPPPEYPEAEGMYQRGLPLRKPIEFTAADIDQLEADLRAAPNNSLGEEYGRTGIEHGQIGKPGLEIKKYGNRTTAYWRGKDGKITAVARGGESGIDSLSGMKIKTDVDPHTRKPIKDPNKIPGGIGGGRGNFEVLRGLVKAGVPMRIDSSLSPYSRGMIETFIKQARKALAEEHK